MIEERQPVRAHKISLLNRNLGVITGVKDVVSFDLNEIILDTDQAYVLFIFHFAWDRTSWYL